MKNLITHSFYQLKAQHTREFVEAISENNTKVVDKYLSHGINVNFVVNSSIRYTPLWYAIYNKQSGMVGQLLKAGANPDLGADLGSKDVNRLPVDSTLKSLKFTQKNEDKKIRESDTHELLKILALLIQHNATLDEQEIKAITKIRLSEPYFEQLMLEFEMPAKNFNSSIDSIPKLRSNKI